MLNSNKIIGITGSGNKIDNGIYMLSVIGITGSGNKIDNGIYMLSVISITGSGNKIAGIYGTKSTMAYICSV
jgi:hypothetical protein